MGGAVNRPGQRHLNNNNKQTLWKIGTLALIKVVNHGVVIIINQLVKDHHHEAKVDGVVRHHRHSNNRKEFMLFF